MAHTLHVSPLHTLLHVVPDIFHDKIHTETKSGQTLPHYLGGLSNPHPAATQWPYQGPELQPWVAAG